MKNIVINVPGMQSSHCQARVNNAVKSIAGVQVLNTGAGTIEVGMGEETLQNKVVNAIEAAGYKVAETGEAASAGCTTGCCTH